MKGLGTRGGVDRKRLQIAVAGAGLGNGPRPAEAAGPQGWAALLGQLGPIVGGLGRYLSQRVDLTWLDDSERSALARLWGTTGEATGGTMADEHGGESTPVLSAFEASDAVAEISRHPESSDWSGSWYRARRADGVPLRLFIRRPGLDEEVEKAAALMRELTTMTRLEPGVVEDFLSVYVWPRIDLAERARQLRRLRAQSPAVIEIPAIVPELTSKECLTLEDSPQAHGLLAGGPMRSRGPIAARLLSACFVDFLAEHGLMADQLHVARLPDGRAFFLDGHFIEMPSPLGNPDGGRVLEFLRATSIERPQDVAAIWRPETEASGIPAGQLRSALRQATPRRGGSAVAGETTAEYAMAYWRAGSSVGLELSAPWRAALSCVEGLRRRLAAWDPDGDALSVALMDHSWREGWQRLRSAATPRHLGMMADRYAQTLAELPYLLDRVLDLPARVTPSAPAPKSRLARALPFLIALASISWVGSSFADREWVEPAATLLFVVLGASLLKVTWR